MGGVRGTQTTIFIYAHRTRPTPWRHTCTTAFSYRRSAIAVEKSLLSNTAYIHYILKAGSCRVLVEHAHMMLIGTCYWMYRSNGHPKSIIYDIFCCMDDCPAWISWPLTRWPRIEALRCVAELDSAITNIAVQSQTISQAGPPGGHGQIALNYSWKQETTSGDLNYALPK